ncbi:MAG TPA: CocE/NonD family hydrolase [Steroidobacteraceae bacterium]|nr:CocE/NonD family hydrolase [Steroidobacteraceae bacterium]
MPSLAAVPLRGPLMRSLADRRPSLTGDTRALGILAACLTGAALAALYVPAAAAQSALPSEIPPHFEVRTESFDYTRRDVDIPMRDGIRLHTVILIPKGAHRAPILLTRTPYGADPVHESAHLAVVLGDLDAASDLVLHDNYIRVYQDVRGKHGSQGDYVMTRPLIGPLNRTQVDHSTDTYDTIDYLVKNIPESNGRVGILGISYDGFTSLMALVHPHPALRAAVPINAMVDGWMGDDWFHKGAFRLDSFTYIQEQEGTRDSSIGWWSDHYDDYDTWLEGSAGDVARAHGLEQTGFAVKIMQHPAYDAFWQDQALDKLLARQKLTVPTMLVHALWDQEDIYGNIHVYQALKAQDPFHQRLFLVLGPWYHHQERLDGSAIGPIRFGSDTALYFRQELLRNFLDHFLKDDPPPLMVAPVTAFETGTNRWLRLTDWPSGCASGCRITPTPLYLQSGGRLSLGQRLAAGSGPGYESYVSDPAKPVPYLPRPIHIAGEGESSWQTWLVQDQRAAAARPDVLTFESAVLTQPLKLSGEPVANLIAATTGTDGDFVVKLIDVYPQEDGRDPPMGGYELMVSADILRGRYRNAYDHPEPIPPNRRQTYRFALPTVNHVFLPGHRLMVQVQSTLFPVYDRNPQTYVPNIFFARPEDYVKATIKVFDAGTDSSYVELPVVGIP